MSTEVWVNIDSGNGLWPNRYQAITCTNVHLLSIGPPGINLKEIWIKTEQSSYQKMSLKMSSAKSWLSGLDLNVLRESSPPAFSLQYLFSVFWANSVWWGFMAGVLWSNNISDRFLRPILVNGDSTAAAF